MKSVVDLLKIFYLWKTFFEGLFEVISIKIQKVWKSTHGRTFLKFFWGLLPITNMGSLPSLDNLYKRDERPILRWNVERVNRLFRVSEKLEPGGSLWTYYLGEPIKLVKDIFLQCLWPVLTSELVLGSLCLLFIQLVYDSFVNTLLHFSWSTSTLSHSHSLSLSPSLLS